MPASHRTDRDHAQAPAASFCPEKIARRLFPKLEPRPPALAEVCAALCLAGERSIIAALHACQFAQAHQRLARGRPPA